MSDDVDVPEGEEVSPVDPEELAQAAEETPAPKKKAAPRKKSGLDKSKPYGTVHGAGPCLYFQDGKYYDGNGKVCEGP